MTPRITRTATAAAATMIARRGMDVLAGGGAYANPPPNSRLDETAVGFVGGSESHDNLQPFLVLNFIIALQGVFPARN